MANSSKAAPKNAAKKSKNANKILVVATQKGFHGGMTRDIGTKFYVKKDEKAKWFAPASEVAAEDEDTEGLV